MRFFLKLSFVLSLLISIGVSASELSDVLENHPEIATSESCWLSSQVTSDAIFKDHPYCHRRNPVASPFLGRGFDVPANVFAQMGSSETDARWKKTPVRRASEIGLDDPLPEYYFALMNHNSAVAWQHILSCARGDADAAREMYRLHDFACGERAMIEAELAELRANVFTLTKTFGIPSSIDVGALAEGISEMEKVAGEMMAELKARLEHRQGPRKWSHLDSDELTTSMQRLGSAIEERKARMSILMSSKNRLQAKEMIQKKVPIFPRMHPLLQEFILEELAALFDPNLSISELTRKLAPNSPALADFKRLTLWTYATEDFHCAANGLWPSAARTAIQVMMEKSFRMNEIRTFSLHRTELKYIVVACSGTGASGDAKLFSRLPDAYLQNRQAIMREISKFGSDT